MQHIQPQRVNFVTSMLEHLTADDDHRHNILFFKAIFHKQLCKLQGFGAVRTHIP
jgi:hypothetical protein